METQLILNIIGVALILVNIMFTYFNFKHTRKKDFQDKLFQQKTDAYKILLHACHNALNRLDINATPYVQIYDYKDLNEWTKYCENNMGPELLARDELNDIIHEQILFLPSAIIDKLIEYSQHCLSFVKSAYNFDTGIIITNQDRLWELYADLLSLMRKDLKFEVIDRGLTKRISG